MINGGLSFWWSDVGLPEARPPLSGSVSADVAIVGAGFTGLWTAWYLAQAGLSVAVLEREFAGWGASGRNGGWLQGEVVGRDGPGASEAFAATVDVVAQWCTEHGVDCDLVKGGSLVVATNPAQSARLGPDRLSGDEVGARIAIADAEAGTFTPDCARIHPAKLVLGLRAAVGDSLYEKSQVVNIAPGVVRTTAGEVRARYVVRATEGYTAGLPGLRRALVPMNSAMVITEPLDAGFWDAVGWEGCETVLTGEHAYCYLQRTADGRIAIGGRGVPYRYGSRWDRSGEVAMRTVDELRHRLEMLFPALRPTPIAHAWCGVLGVPRDWQPFVTFDRSTGMGAAGGYVGDGVAAANLAGRTLRDLSLGADTELTRLPWVGHRPRSWEPEPLRWTAIRTVYALYRRADAVEARTGRPSRWANLAGAIAGR